MVRSRSLGVAPLFSKTSCCFCIVSSTIAGVVRDFAPVCHVRDDDADADDRLNAYIRVGVTSSMAVEFDGLLAPNIADIADTVWAATITTAAGSIRA